MNYISLIEELKKRGSIPGLDAIQGLLEELGHPEPYTHSRNERKRVCFGISFFYNNGSRF